MLPSAEDSSPEGRFQELYASAREARRRAREAVRRAETIRVETRAALDLHREARARVVRAQELWLSGQREQLRYSAMARLQAQLANTPVIEQAKGVLMARCRWTGDQALDTLRQASQRSNIRIRDLAAMIVASVTSPPRAQPRGAAGRLGQERSVALLSARAPKAAARPRGWVSRDQSVTGRSRG